MSLYKWLADIQLLAINLVTCVQPFDSYTIFNVMTASLNSFVPPTASQDVAVKGAHLLLCIRKFFGLGKSERYSFGVADFHIGWSSPFNLNLLRNMLSGGYRTQTKRVSLLVLFCCNVLIGI